MSFIQHNNFVYKKNVSDNDNGTNLFQTLEEFIKSDLKWRIQLYRLDSENRFEDICNILDNVMHSL